MTFVLKTWLWVVMGKSQNFGSRSRNRRIRGSESEPCGSGSARIRICRILKISEKIRNFVYRFWLRMQVKILASSQNKSTCVKQKNLRGKNFSFVHFVTFQTNCFPDSLGSVRIRIRPDPKSESGTRSRSRIRPPKIAKRVGVESARSWDLPHHYLAVAADQP